MVTMTRTGFSRNVAVTINLLQTVDRPTVAAMFNLWFYVRLFTHYSGTGSPNGNTAMLAVLHSFGHKLSETTNNISHC